MVDQSKSSGKGNIDGFHSSNGFHWMVGGYGHLCVNLYEACLCEKTIGAIFQETLVPEDSLWSDAEDKEDDAEVDMDKKNIMWIRMRQRMSLRMKIDLLLESLTIV